MERYKLITNELFFNRMIKLLKDGGTWMWPDEMEIFTKQGEKFLTTQNGLDRVKQIVRHDYFKKHFSLKK